MTITRIWQSGLETNGANSHLGEFSSITGLSVTTSSVRYKSGTYSLRINGTSYVDVIIPATYQLRSSFHIVGMELLTNSFPANIISFRSSTTVLVGIQVKNNTSLALRIGATEQATFSLATPTTEFSHFGLDVKFDGSAGWAIVYLDGNEIMRFEGNTGTVQPTVVRFGDTTNPLDFTYFDDMFIDDTTGEATFVPVPDRRFFSALTPNGNGNYVDGVGSDSNSVDNYLLVDDVPHNSDTDYVVLDALNEKESYAVTTLTLPANFEVAALIPFMYAKKTDAEVATQIKPMLRLGSTDLEGDAKNLPTSYGLISHRFTTKPGGGVWAQADIDDVQIGYVGAGTF